MSKLGKKKSQKDAQHKQIQQQLAALQRKNEAKSNKKK